MFINDATGSMSPYINKVKKELRKIIKNLISVADKHTIDLHIGFIVYRDHGDGNGLIEKQGITNDYDELEDFISGLETYGGFKVPGIDSREEAVVDGFWAAKGLDWSKDAYKCCVLIGDAPPHGYHENGKKNPKDPCGCNRDVMEVVEEFKNEKKILGIHAIACHPSILGIWGRIAEVGGGVVLSLSNASELPGILEEAFSHIVEVMDKDDFIIKTILDQKQEDHTLIATQATEYFGEKVTKEFVKERIEFLRETPKWNTVKEEVIKKVYHLNVSFTDIPSLFEGKIAFSFNINNYGTILANILYSVNLVGDTTHKLFEDAIAVPEKADKTIKVSKIIPETVDQGNYTLQVILKRIDNKEKNTQLEKNVEIIKESKPKKGDITIEKIDKALLYYKGLAGEITVNLKNHTNMDVECNIVAEPHDSSLDTFFSDIIHLNADENKDYRNKIKVNKKTGTIKFSIILSADSEEIAREETSIKIIEQ